MPPSPTGSARSLAAGTAGQPGGRISLALVIHNHQPVGNFGWVMADVWEHAYLPMIDALERHPAVRLGLHYSGPLLGWMAEDRPDALDRVAALVARGQVELLGGGWAEPILVSLPVADRHGQLLRMADEVERWCGVRPRGAWLAERVWEPSLAFDLADAGYAYTVLDDNHLRGAAVADEDMWGTYVVDDQGRMLTVFGTEQGLRYTIPWRPVPEVIAHLRRHVTADGRTLGVMGDDGEKFGGWPGTHEACWGEGRWMETFFEALEANATWLSTVRPSDWLDAHPPLGRVAIPTASYLEMTEWALPPEDALVFQHLVERARAKGDHALRFLRGGTWRAFQARYREVNDLHKQMLRTSAKVAAMPEGTARERAREHLYRGQSNDAYWHGLFGGVYLPDLRMAVLSELIGAEDVADDGRIRGGVGDWDLDGVDEVLLSGPGQSLLVDLDDGAGVGAWDLLAARVATASLLRRRPEAYHGRLREAVAVEARSAATVATGAAVATGVAASPHEALTVKEAGLERYLVYDRHERRQGVVHLLDIRSAPELGPAELAAETFADLGDFAGSPFVLTGLEDAALTVRRDGTVTMGGRPSPLTMEKRFALSGTRMEPVLEVRLTLTSVKASAFELDLEWPFMLLGGGGNPAAWYEVAGADGIARDRHDGTGDHPALTGLAFGNDLLGVRIEVTMGPAARVSWHPIETVSKSEAGFERVYQGSAVHLRWPMSLDAGAPVEVLARFVARQAFDRATLAQHR